jgi:hypothetical protein
MSSLRVRPSLRLLCMGVGVLLLTGAIALWRAGDLVGHLGAIGTVGGLFLLLGTAGNLDEEDETPASERFRELADPSRTLSPEDLRSPTREPVREDAVRTTPKQAPRP